MERVIFIYFYHVPLGSSSISDINIIPLCYESLYFRHDGEGGSVRWQVEDGELTPFSSNHLAPRLEGPGMMTSNMQKKKKKQ